MSDFQSPYNFVSLSSHVFEPDWKDDVSHDLPFEDGLSGQIAYRLTAIRPLVVGGSRRSSKQGEPAKVAFVHRPGQPNAVVIPGSSIRGLLRNVVEIASFGRMRLVHRGRRLALRDLGGKAKDEYIAKITASEQSRDRSGRSVTAFRSRVSAGFLNFDAARGMWRITPCEMGRIEAADLMGLQQNTAPWAPHTPAPAKYKDFRKANGGSDELWIIAPEAQAHLSHRLNKHIFERRCALAKEGEQGAKRARVVLTGQPNKLKHREFVFFDPRPDQAMDVEPSLFRATAEIHVEAEKAAGDKLQTWKFWFDGVHQPDIPVFWLSEAEVSRGGRADAVHAFGLSMMFRLPARRTVGEMLDAHYGGPSKASTDLPELIFGRLPSGLDEGGLGSEGLRSRVSISMAEPTGSKVERITAGTWLLNSPKPSWYPAYLVQNEPQPGKGVNTYATWITPNAQLRGFKRYQPRTQTPPLNTPSSNPPLSTTLEAVRRGTAFEGVIRFHNLKPAELGALLWALDFGGAEGAQHTLGMGKPYGFGACSLEALPDDPRTRVTRVCDGTRVSDPGEAVTAFTAKMDAWHRAQGAGAWADSLQVRELIALALPAGPASATPYAAAAPAAFADVKKDGRVLRAPLGTASRRA